MCKPFKNWPYGRAIYSNEDNTFCTRVNNMEHIEIISRMKATPENHCDIIKAYDLLSRGHDQLDQILNFAKDDYVGYTSQFVKDLEVLNAYVMIKLPFYKHYKDKITREYIASKYSL
jgi:protein-arginine kinase